MIDEKISQANGRLKTARVRAKIQRIGDKLYLQATLPPKPGSHETRRSQQRIALGISATPSGVVLAEKKARKVSADLDCNEFSWNPYLTTKHLPPETVGGWVKQFESGFRHTVEESTWVTDYYDAFKRLNQDEPLTVGLLLAEIKDTNPDTRIRKRLCHAFGKLAKLAGLEYDFKSLQGNYSARAVDPRNLPSDEEIISFWQQMTNPAWKWVYGAIATFGLRPHEAFFLDVTDLANGGETVTVLKGKTNKRKPRQVWAYYPEWVEAFNLREQLLPPVTGKKHTDYGDRVTHYLRVTAKMPFLPYDLRHSWSRRAVVFGLPDALAAQQMGHSLKVHNETYQCWIDARTHQQVHESLKARSDRPAAPSL